jgi:hypothetical protein
MSNKPCIDCGMDTEPWPPHRGTQEHYIVKDSVWQQAGMPLAKMASDMSLHGGGGCLCVGCIEKRLGRLLTVDDFKPLTLKMLKSGCQSTPRLLSRVGVAYMSICSQPLPDCLVDDWLSSTLKSALKDQPEFRGIRDVDVEGDAVYVLLGDDEALRFRAGGGIAKLREGLRWDREPEGGHSIDLLPWDGEEPDEDDERYLS